MIYLSGHVSDLLPPEMGVMVTPMMGNRLPDSRTWAADSGCFSAPAQFDPLRYLGFLAKYQYAADRCLFATMPDVVGDAKATLAAVKHWPAILRAMGFRPALVAQDGLERLPVPWDDFDCLFTGGTTRWKLSEAAYQLALEAKNRGKWIHMGRVNSARRLRAAAISGYQSADGTFLAFGPDVNLPRVARWMQELETQHRMEIA